MRRALTSSLILITLMLAAGCGSGGDLQKPQTQREFGVRMAKMNLWREAMFRFRRAVEIDPNDAQARNNLAVALEAVGDFDGAAKEYREALRLDRTDQHIQKNYSRYVEFMQRSKKRETVVPAARAATPPADPSTPAISTDATPIAAPATPPPAPPVPETAPPATGTAQPPSTDTAAPPPPTTTNPPFGGVQ